MKTWKPNPIEFKEYLGKLPLVLENSQTNIVHNHCGERVWYTGFWMYNGATYIQFSCNCNGKEPDPSVSPKYSWNIELKEPLQSQLDTWDLCLAETDKIYKWVWKVDGPRMYSTWVEKEDNEPSTAPGIERDADKWDFWKLSLGDAVTWKIIHNGCKRKLTVTNPKYIKGILNYNNGDLVEFACGCNRFRYIFPMRMETDQLVIKFWQDNFKFKQDNP